MAIFYAKIGVLSITLSQIKIDLKIKNNNSIANKMLEKFIKL